MPSSGWREAIFTSPAFSIAGVPNADSLESDGRGVAGFGGGLQVRTRGRGAGGCAQRDAALKLCHGGHKSACADVKKDDQNRGQGLGIKKRRSIRFSLQFHRKSGRIRSTQPAKHSAPGEGSPMGAGGECGGEGSQRGLAEQVPACANQVHDGAGWAGGES